MSGIMPENRGIDPKVFDQTLEKFDRASAYRSLGFSIVYLGKGTVGIRLTASPQLENSHGLLHGGIVATLMDTAMGFCLGTLDLQGLSIALNLNYLLPVSPGTELTAHAQLLQVNQSTATGEARVLLPDGRPAAVGRCSFCLIQDPR